MAIRVLVVDDSLITLQAVAARLGQAGMVVTLLEDARELEAAIQQQAPDLILLDVSMPGKGPESIVQELKRQEQSSSIPVLLHSDRDEDELEEIVRRVGADGHLRKTSNSDEMVEMIRRWTERAPEVDDSARRV